MNIINMGNNFLKDRLLKQSYEDFYVEAKDKFELHWEMNAKNTANKEDFLILKQLEMGCFGRGVLVQNKKNKVSYVMKMLDKQTIIKNGNLGKNNYPFLYVFSSDSIYFTFQRPEKIKNINYLRKPNLT